MSVAGRSPVNYGYDPAGRLKTISQGSGTFAYGYDILSRRTSLDRPNGVRTTYSYDELNRLTRLVHAKSGNAPIEDFQYSYNLDDEIQGITSLASTTLLPAAKTVSPADAANRIAQFGSATYTLDLEGQTTSKTDEQGTTNYQWDARGRLKQASLPSSQSVSYGYDALGRRSSRTAGGVTTSFLYDGLDVVLDRGTDGSTVDYLNGENTDEKLRQGSGLYFLQDHLGSSTALSDADGIVVGRIQFEAFGESTGSPFTRYDYTGRERDSLTGLIYYRARWLDQQRGRFLSEDPKGLAGGLNLYAYVQSDPINFTDPLGLQVYECKRPLKGTTGQDDERNGPDMCGNPFYHQYLCEKKDGICKGLNPSPGAIWYKRSKGVNNSADVYDAKNCKEVPGSDDCLVRLCLRM